MELTSDYSSKPLLAPNIVKLCITQSLTDVHVRFT